MPSAGLCGSLRTHIDGSEPPLSAHLAPEKRERPGCVDFFGNRFVDDNRVLEKAA
jgi:hypothetical protein